MTCPPEHRADVVTLHDPVDATWLRRALRDRAEDVFLDLWGEPRNPSSLRWRPRRSRPGDDPRRMVMRGAQRGLWYDSARGQGGDLLDLIAVERLRLPDARGDFRRVLEEANRWLGTPPQAIKLHRGGARRPQGTDNERNAKTVADLLAAVVAVAEPLGGCTLRYWTETRGLDPPPPATILRVPAGVLPRRPKGSRLPFVEREAVLVLGRDVRGEVCALQRILLRPGGITRDPGLPKFALGPIGAFPPFFPARSRDVALGILALAEGPETAGAIWSAAGARVLVCGGGLARRVRGLSYLSTVIVAMEADAPENPTRKALVRAVAEARANGARVGLLDCGGKPGSGFDAADLIRQEGGRQVLRKRIARLARRLFAARPGAP